MVDSTSLRSRFALAAAAVLALIAVYARPAWADAASPLDATIADVQKRWPDIKQISGDDLTKITKDGKTVVFDVRLPEEYAVSHLDGAINVDPGLTAAAFLTQHAEKLKGKTAVFYCAVGVRSSKLAERVGADALQSAGATSSVNLSGGIFAWHGAEKPLIDANGPTKLVHGYDATWGKLVKRQDMLATEPAK